MAGKREDPGQKHSTCRAHPVPALWGAVWDDHYR
jgi:hypothetical protein